MPTTNIFRSEHSFFLPEHNFFRLSLSLSLKRGEFLKIIICLKITLENSKTAMVLPVRGLTSLYAFIHRVFASNVCAL